MAKNFRNLFIALVGLIASAVLLLPLAQWTMGQLVFQPKLDAHFEHVASYYPKMKEDLRLLSENPLFPTVEPTANAESLISTFVSWKSDKSQPLDTPAHQALSALFEKHPNWATDPAALDALRADPDLATVDAAWMDHLAQFTHWDISTHPSVTSQLSRIPTASGLARIGIVSSLPVPDFGEFRKWAAVRALQKQVAGDPAEAVQGLRKAAELMNSTGTLLGSLTAVLTLKDERLIGNGTELPNWTFVSEESASAYRRMILAWPSILQASWFRGFPQEFEAFLQPQYGICPAASEFSSGLFHFADFLADNAPLEGDLTNELASSREIHKRLFASCNLTFYDALLERAPADLVAEAEDELAPSPTPYSSSPVLVFGIKSTHIPYIRRLVGMTLLTLSTPSLTPVYESTATN